MAALIIYIQVQKTQKSGTKIVRGKVHYIRLNHRKKI